MIACLWTSAVVAQDKPLAVRELDKQLFDVLKDVHNRGADLFNAGDAIGSYRLFEGALRTARAALAHRPAEQRFIDGCLAEAEKKRLITQKAFILHETIDQLRTRLRAPAIAEPNAPELLPVLPRENREILPPPNKPLDP